MGEKPTCREITPRQLVVNCLYGTTHLIPVEPDLWRYLATASKLIKTRIRDIVIKDDYYSIENVLFYNDHLIAKFQDGDVRLVGLNNEFRKEKYFYEVVNGSLDDDIRTALPQLISEAYQMYCTQGKKSDA